MSESNHDTGGVKAETSSWSRFWSRLTAEPEPSIAHRLYDRLVRHARFPIYYGRLGVPDTPEGRFEVLALHVGLAVRKLSSQGDEGRKAGQALFDLMVADLDMNLRELGVGDLSVGKQVKRLAQQFYARLAVLSDAFDDDRHDVLSPMLQTNVVASSPSASEQAAALADIVVALSEALDRHDPVELMAGKVILPDEPALTAIVDRKRLNGAEQ
ncbi:MAG: ubiquinol-cytochrome C chaperone family protein [Pseudomonadota bacterium]